MMQFFYIAFLSVAGIGFIPVGPGTVASIVSTPLLLLFAITLPSSTAVKIGIVGGLLVSLCALTILSLKQSAYIPHSRYDQSFVVIDEVIGVATALMPFFFLSPSLSVIFLTIIVFRFFDIVKPLGISRIDQRNTPLSVILDDILAGGYTAISILLLLRFVPLH